ncbi:NUDIX hydrolase [Methylobacterium tarhaniae]|uniref:GDP-mannose pyrophosphatase n=1 Tax=Methylobacterium tarhaniae TaxID=1187852 RepID=A0A0J6VCA9_9HYPH|nr:NUDIX domain-containing protein [Methylobacterium tarhaniae]KMO36681.1 NUDIX hydrolase [Methylobacterium tarhaniae]
MTDNEHFRLRVLHQGWNTFGIATIRTAHGDTVDRAFEHHGAAAGVLPYDPERRCALLVRQDRVGVLYWGETEPIAEVPAGGLDRKSPEATAVEEALEEAGVRLSSLELVVEAYAMPSVSSERIWLYLAPYSEGDRIAEGGGLAAEGERLIVEEIGLDALARLAAAGELRDMKTLVLLQALQLRRPELFAA